MILAGDVGGTNTRLGVFSFEGGRLVGNGEEQVPSRGRSGLSEIVSAFLEGQRVPIRAAAFGIWQHHEQGLPGTTREEDH